VVGIRRSLESRYYWSTEVEENVVCELDPENPSPPLSSIDFRTDCYLRAADYNGNGGDDDGEYGGGTGGAGGDELSPVKVQIHYSNFSGEFCDTTPGEGVYQS
jgi:hypothetical protein